MGRRRKKDPPKERISADWYSYKPFEPLYWATGGPFIPVEDIPAQPYDLKWIGGAASRKARRRWALACQEQSTTDLATAVARYRAVKEKGMEALDPWVREAWRQKVHTGGALCQSRDGTVQGEPDPVSTALALAYREIGYHRGRLLACEQVIDDIDRTHSPLLFRRGIPDPW